MEEFETFEDDDFKKDDSRDGSSAGIGPKELTFFLLRDDFQKIIKKYRQDTGELPSYGRYFLIEFENWIKNSPDIKENRKIEYFKKIKAINQNNIIEHILTDEIKNSNRTQQEIIDNISSKFSIHISRWLVGEVANKILNKRQYEIRFRRNITEKKEADCVYLIFKTTLSLNEIAKKLEISSSPVERIANEVMTKEMYNRRFPSNKNKIDAKKRTGIKYLINNSNKNQQEIAKESGISPSSIARIAKKELKEQYEKRFPDHNKLNEETRDEIIDNIKNTSLNLSEMAEESGVCISTVLEVARKTLSKKAYEKRFQRDKNLMLGLFLNDFYTKQFAKWGKRKGFKILTEYEILKKIPEFKEIGSRPDSLIDVDEKFRKLYGIPSHIKYIVLDYTTDISQKSLFKKSRRGYQSEDTLFIHVPFALDKKIRSQKIYQIPRDVPCSNNIWVLPEVEFLKFFKFSKEEKRFFREGVRNVQRKIKHMKSLFEYF